MIHQDILNSSYFNVFKLLPLLFCVWINYNFDNLNKNKNSENNNQTSLEKESENNENHYPDFEPFSQNNLLTRYNEPIQDFMLKENLSEFTQNYRYHWNPQNSNPYIILYMILLNRMLYK